MLRLGPPRCCKTRSSRHWQPCFHRHTPAEVGRAAHSEVGRLRKGPRNNACASDAKVLDRLLGKAGRSAPKREKHLCSCPNPVTADRSWRVGVCSKPDVCVAQRSTTRQGGVTLLLSQEAPIAADWLTRVSAATPAVADPARLQLTCLRASISINEIPIIALLHVHHCSVVSFYMYLRCAVYLRFIASGLSSKDMILGKIQTSTPARQPSPQSVDRTPVPSLRSSSKKQHSSCPSLLQPSPDTCKSHHPLSHTKLHPIP